jgi:hypothetical protein
MINECVHNHPLKFGNKDREMVGILVVAYGTKHNELWRFQK